MTEFLNLHDDELRSDLIFPLETENRAVLREQIALARERTSKLFPNFVGAVGFGSFFYGQGTFNDIDLVALYAWEDAVEYPVWKRLIKESQEYFYSHFQKTTVKSRYGSSWDTEERELPIFCGRDHSELIIFSNESSVLQGQTYQILKDAYSSEKAEDLFFIDPEKKDWLAQVVSRIKDNH
jgi:hypothetical protein